MTFEASLDVGRVGESVISLWFREKGYSVLPVYEVEMHTGKGPRLFAPRTQLIAPDMLVFRAKDAYWIEAKHKSAFTWHRKTGRWTTGIDLHHYADYCAIDDMATWPVWLLFVQRGGRAKGDSEDSPAGLFGNKLSILRECENHRHSNWGTSGMVYWSIDSLELLATPWEVEVLEMNVKLLRILQEIPVDERHQNRLNV